MSSAADIEIIARGRARLRWHREPPPQLSTDRQRVVDELWERGIAELGDALYDNPLLVYREHETAGDLTTIHGVYRSYRYYYAQAKDSNFDCGMAPIGVSGLTVFSEGETRAVAIGRRSKTVAYYAGSWECIPSGGMDDSFARADGTVDFAAMLLDEFEEEACLPPDRVRCVTPFAVIYDRIARTYDICCELPVATTRDELIAAMRRSDEYSEVMVVTENELGDCVRQLGDELIPLSRGIIEIYRQANGLL